MNCIRWTKSIRPDGYGELNFNGKTARAHRVAYIQANGLTLDDIKGKVVRHRCDNPSCVNPEHLEIGTHMDNTRDRLERDRGAKGEKQGSAKLCAEDIRKIRKLLSEGVPQRTIAKQFSVAQSQIWSINIWKTWRHV